MNEQTVAKTAHIEMLYREYGQTMFRRAVSFLKDQDEAWDVVQEVFKRLLAFADRLDLSEQTHRYLYRCTTNVILARFNQQKRQRVLAERWEQSQMSFPAAQEDRGLAQRIAQMDLQAMRHTLNEEEWELLHYRFGEGLSTTEIGEIFAISDRGVRKRLQKLAQRLQHVERHM